MKATTTIRLNLEGLVKNSMKGDLLSWLGTIRVAGSSAKFIVVSFSFAALFKFRLGPCRL